MIIPFSKLVPQITESSIWNEPSDIRIVWITMLAKKDENGYVRGDAKTLSRIANVPIESCQEALRLFQEPDPSSHTPDNEGRRISPAPGGWTVLNHEIYLQAGWNEEQRAEWRLRKQRQRKNKGGMSRNVPECPGTDAGHDVSISPSISAPESGGDVGEPTEAEFVEFCSSPTCGILPAEATDLYLKLKQGGWVDGRGVKVKDWRSYARRMRKYIEQDRNKPTGGNGAGKPKRKSSYEDAEPVVAQ